MPSIFLTENHFARWRGHSLALVGDEDAESRGGKTVRLPVSGVYEPVGLDGRWQALRIRRTESTPATLPIAVLEGISPTSSLFAVEGQIRYRDVQGDAYLEMWTVFPDGSRYFSRTLLDDGPMKKISGTSDWRVFSLPFTITTSPLPERVTLEINLVMPGRGIIDIGPFRIANLSPDLYREHGYWWTGQTAGWIGGLFGVGIALVTILLNYLVRRQVPYSFIRGVLLVEFGLGVIAFAAGLVAMMYCFQPYFVNFPLIFLGAFMCFYAPAGAYRLRRYYREIELRKMRAMDLQ